MWFSDFKGAVCVRTFSPLMGVKWEKMGCAHFQFRTVHEEQQKKGAHRWRENKSILISFVPRKCRQWTMRFTSSAYRNVSIENKEFNSFNFKMRLLKSHIHMAFRLYRISNPNNKQNERASLLWEYRSYTKHGHTAHGTRVLHVAKYNWKKNYASK